MRPTKEIIEPHWNDIFDRDREIERLRAWEEKNRSTAEMQDKAIAGIAKKNDELRKEAERLRAILRDVIAGNWSVTGLQEALGDIGAEAKEAE